MSNLCIIQKNSTVLRNFQKGEEFVLFCFLEKLDFHYVYTVHAFV